MLECNNKIVNERGQASIIKRSALLSVSSSVTTKYFTVALLSLAEIFREILDKKKGNRGKRMFFFLPKLRESVRYAGYAEFLRGTDVLLSLPPLSLSPPDPSCTTQRPQHGRR